ncbi:protein DMP10-like [Argentina anserina]|uniref:protein DMP10-like n=1 Tax=Argentina anserina TaxID=57926 RepID=UPI0021769291|nr:protein DMP10-like [Potentilla anserina]
MKIIGSAANLANLLPTGTVLAFEALIPSFSNNGECHPANKVLSISMIIICVLICLISSFTDSFIYNGKFYYGIITRAGMHILNPRENVIAPSTQDYRIKPIDFFHAFVSLTLFMILALTNLNVENCFFPDASEDLNQIIINLPLGAGVLASFLFTIFPTTRRGIGYSWEPELKRHGTSETGVLAVGAEAEAKASTQQLFHNAFCY